MLVLTSKHIPKAFTSLHFHCFLSLLDTTIFTWNILSNSHLPLFIHHFTLIMPSPRDLSESVAPVLTVHQGFPVSITWESEVLTNYSKGFDIDTCLCYSLCYSHTGLLVCYSSKYKHTPISEGLCFLFPLPWIVIHMSSFGSNPFFIQIFASYQSI